jgi:hypothetical protein
MKSFSVKIFFITLLCLTSAGCKKAYNISNKQEILFQFDYVNYAWGYQHNGFIITKEGEVLTYNNPEVWNFPDKDFSLTIEEVNENIGYCLNSGKKISKAELQKYSNYIKNIASSKVTAPKNVAADAGSTEFICYQFSENTGIYKGYIIKTEGDFRSENLNFYSKKVVLWMRTIKNALPKN